MSTNQFSPYRESALATVQLVSKPRWRIVKQHYPAETTEYKYWVQKRYWIFWFNVTWDQNEAMAHQTLREKIKESRKPDKPIIIHQE